MKSKHSLGSNLFQAFDVLVMLLLVVATAYPVYFVLIASVSDPTELTLHSGEALLLPLKPLTFDAYRRVLANPMIGTGYKNTIFILCVGVALNMALTISGGYFLSLKGLLLKRPIMLLIVFTMYFSGGLIPGYLNVKSLGMIDTLWALIIPGAISTYNMIIMRTGFSAIPDSLIESARLDGASHARIMVRIATPLCVPTIAVLVLYYAVGHWNSWFSASIYLQSRSKWPLQLVMRTILNSSQSSSMMEAVDMDEIARLTELLKYALIVISTAPILILYPFLQKYFVKGALIGAVKG